MPNNENALTMEQVGETLQYFDAFHQAYMEQNGNSLGSFRGRYYTPDMTNRILKIINNNPQEPISSKKIDEALANPNSSEQILRNYAVYFEANNIFYKRLINFNANLLAWNLTFDCINIEKDSDFTSEEFLRDTKIVDEFCSKFNLKRDFRIITNEILRQGVYFGVFRDEAETYCWQELPSDYCTINGDSNVGKLFNFDFSFFMRQTGSNIDLYPPIFKRLLNKIYKQRGEKYKPSNKDSRHGSDDFSIDLSPRDNFFCFTIDDGVMTLIPYYSSLFPDMYLQPMMRDLEKNKAMIAAQKLLVNLLDTYDNAKSGTVPNQYKITSKDVGKFMALVKQALGDVTKALALPAKDTKIVDFNVEAKNRYTDYQRNIAASSLSSSASMLTENKLNVFESELALNIDENFIKSLYGQFENFLNYYINRKTSKFKFKFRLHDTNTKIDRDMRKDQFKELAGMGIVDINLLARATDQNVFEARRALKYTKSLNIEDDLISLMSLNNQSQDTGRPKSTNSLNENTNASKERGSDELSE